MEEHSRLQGPRPGNQTSRVFFFCKNVLSRTQLSISFGCRIHEIYYPHGSSVIQHSKEHLPIQTGSDTHLCCGFGMLVSCYKLRLITPIWVRLCGTPNLQKLPQQSGKMIQKCPASLPSASLSYIFGWPALLQVVLIASLTPYPTDST